MTSCTPLTPAAYHHLQLQPPPSAAAAAALSPSSPSSNTAAAATSSSRYENQKRRDWNTFGQYLRNHRPPLHLSRCSGAVPSPPAPCPCPLRQAWGSLDALIGRLRAAFEEHGGKPENNPFGARAVRLYLREVRDSQAKARGISYDKKKRSRNNNTNNKLSRPSTSSSSSAAGSASNVSGDRDHEYLLLTCYARLSTRSDSGPVRKMGRTHLSDRPLQGTGLEVKLCNFFL
ncbi:unnamed protein product [Linum tenue]|uniref:ALOG domain-containing protein n=1 Tax=Linum tenue TaxID=586396 RepID=A0AAV0NH25_9ROSI|nr:unnamed protein product [Linum tenue]